MMSNVGIMYGGLALAGQFLDTFKDFRRASARRVSPSTRRWKTCARALKQPVAAGEAKDAGWSSSLRLHRPLRQCGGRLFLLGA